MDSLESVLIMLRAAAEPTRLRLLAALAEGELTVTELVHIVGQSQPRVSRHLKQLCDAKMVDRSREGQWILYRLADRAAERGAAGNLLALIPATDSRLALDRKRRAAIKKTQAESAQAYFRDNAARWDRIRSLYVPESEVERALSALIPKGSVRALLDIGTGTGRILQLFADSVESGLGIDLSREMLALARANLERAGIRNCHVRQADMYRLPLADSSVDAAVFHQVLHFAADPTHALVEAARVLRPAGRIVIIDFAPHALEFLRAEHAHRRLGFGDDEVRAWLIEAGLTPGEIRKLPGETLTVVLWEATKPAVSDRAAQRTATQTLIEVEA